MHIEGKTNHQKTALTECMCQHLDILFMTLSGSLLRHTEWYYSSLNSSHVKCTIYLC